MALQLAGSLVLLVGAAMFVQSARAAFRIDRGFEPEGVALVTLDPERQGMDAEESRAFYRDLGERVGSLPGVTGYALAATMPVQPGGDLELAVLRMHALTSWRESLASPGPKPPRIR